VASIYDPISQRALDTISKKGATVTFPGTNTGAVYDPATDTWSGGSTTAVAGKAVQTKGDVDRFKALNLVLVNPVSLLIAAKNLAVTPLPGMTFTWAGKNYTIKDVDPVAPDGVPILFKVTGDV
jgi:hypothetical protein